MQASLKELCLEALVACAVQSSLRQVLNHTAGVFVFIAVDRS